MNFETSRPCIIPNPEDIVSLESLSAHASARDTPPCSARFNATWSSLNLSPIPLLSLRRCDSNSSDGEKVQVKIVGVRESFVLDVKSNIEVFVLKSIIAERLDVCQSRISLHGGSMEELIDPLSLCDHEFMKVDLSKEPLLISVSIATA